MITDGHRKLVPVLGALSAGWGSGRGPPDGGEVRSGGLSAVSALLGAAWGMGNSSVESAVQAVPALRCNRRYAVLAACGRDAGQFSWRDGILVATALRDFRAARERHETVNTSGWTTRFYPGPGPRFGPISLGPAERVRFSRGGFPQNVDNVDNPTARASGVRSWGPFIETGGGLEFRRNTRTGWIVDSGYLIVRRPRGP